MGITYLKILTEQQVETIKLPRSIHEFKYRHQLKANSLLQLELIKTRKNWILVRIISSIDFLTPDSYRDYLNLAECLKLVSANLKENQQTDTLEWLKGYFASNWPNFNIQLFTHSFSKHLGFGEGKLT